MTTGIVPLSARKASERNHACPFSNRLTENVIRAFTTTGQTVCDPYSGSGTTAMVSAQLDRNFVGSERDSAYHSASLDRIQVIQSALF